MTAASRARYVAIITDGNGRWAKQRGLPVLAGHEAGADVVKARLRDAVEGVYGNDPRVDPAAKLLPELTHLQAIERGLRVMDSTALSLCMDNDLPIYVFNMEDERNIDRIVCGERVGTVVRSG